jgi:hypothetical protein
MLKTVIDKTIQKQYHCSSSNAMDFNKENEKKIARNNKKSIVIGCKKKTSISFEIT